VSCDFGVPVVWEGLAGALWTVAAVAAGDAVRHVIAPDPAGARRMVAWTAWGAVVLLATAVLVIDRTLQALDLALGALVMLCALVLIARTVGDRLRLSRAVLAGVFAGPMIAVLLIPAWAPAAFRAAERADSARQDEDRRQRSQECRENLAAGRTPDGPSATVLQACDFYPPPIGRGHGGRATTTSVPVAQLPISAATTSRTASWSSGALAPTPDGEYVRPRMAADFGWLPPGNAASRAR